MVNSQWETLWAFRDEEGMQPSNTLNVKAGQIRSSCLTFLSKDPSLVHAGSEEYRGLSGTHEKVCNGQVYYKHVGRCP